MQLHRTRASATVVSHASTFHYATLQPQLQLPWPLQLLYPHNYIHRYITVRYNYSCNYDNYAAPTLVLTPMLVPCTAIPIPTQLPDTTATTTSTSATQLEKCYATLHCARTTATTTNQLQMQLHITLTLHYTMPGYYIIPTLTRAATTTKQELQLQLRPHLHYTTQEIAR